MGKYDKYFISGNTPEFGAFPGVTLAYLNDKVCKRSHLYNAAMYGRVPTGILTELTTVTAWNQVYHGSHIHKDAEILFHFGTNPDDPMDLGAEVEIYMGPELEKHVITKSCAVYIPPGFIHAPYRTVRVDRPYIFMEVNQGPMHTEKSYKQLVPEKDRGKMVWADEGYGTEMKAELPKDFIKG